MRDLFKKAAELSHEGKPFAWATVVKTSGSSPRKLGAKMLVLPSGGIFGSIGGGVMEALTIDAAVEALREGTSLLKRFNLDPEAPRPIGMMCGGEVEVFIDVVKNPFRLLILGGGHVAKALAEAASAAGIRHDIVEDRPEFSRRERFPNAGSIHTGKYREVIPALPIDEDTHIVIVTRCHSFDVLCLEESLKTRAGYIGLIGSEHKVERIFSILRRRGVAPEEDPRVYAPVGLALGDYTPGQIAISILAEVLKVRGKSSGEHMRLAMKKLEAINR